jgi:hypothetical protein
MQQCAGIWPSSYSKLITPKFRWFLCRYNFVWLIGIGQWCVSLVNLYSSLCSSHLPFQTQTTPHPVSIALKSNRPFPRSNVKESPEASAPGACWSIFDFWNISLPPSLTLHLHVRSLRHPGYGALAFQPRSCRARERERAKHFMRVTEMEIYYSSVLDGRYEHNSNPQNSVVFLLPAPTPPYPILFSSSSMSGNF